MISAGHEAQVRPFRTIESPEAVEVGEKSQSQRTAIVFQQGPAMGISRNDRPIERRGGQQPTGAAANGDRERV